MDIYQVLKQQGWELIERKDWIAARDRRPEFRAAFLTSRVGKVEGTCFYVTLTQFPETVQELIRQLGDKPVPLKSTNSLRDATYWGFDTNGVPEEDLTIFATRLAAVINQHIDQ